jgi:hypothetical protein
MRLRRLQYDVALRAAQREWAPKEFVILFHTFQSVYCWLPLGVRSARRLVALRER